MTLTKDQLLEQMMRLPAVLRAELAEELVASLDGEEGEEIRKMWAKEAVRRRDELRNGKVQAIAGEEVLAEVRRAVGR